MARKRVEPDRHGASGLPDQESRASVNGNHGHMQEAMAHFESFDHGCCVSEAHDDRLGTERPSDQAFASPPCWRRSSSWYSFPEESVHDLCPLPPEALAAPPLGATKWRSMEFGRFRVDESVAH